MDKLEFRRMKDPKYVQKALEVARRKHVRKKNGNITFQILRLAFSVKLANEGGAIGMKKKVSAAVNYMLMNKMSVSDLPEPKIDTSKRVLIVFNFV